MPDYEHLLTEMQDHFGLSHMSYYWVCPPPGSRSENILFTTYPKDWIEHYFERNYGESDPVLRFARQTLLPFGWDDLRSETALSRSFFEEAEDFGVGHTGLSVPVWGRFGESALFSVTAEWSKTDWEGFLDGHLADLSHAALLLHDSVMSNITAKQDGATKALSVREVEVLEWAARGKTAWETAQILGLSEKTVYFYLRRATSKLGVSSKTQAVARAAVSRVIQL
ncbi:LuxR family transcriptional regulator [Pontivivens ytuae]|uniref:LuxR family transcriptional regulator n=1 Tax=Pontivivens ytuae TaxID=2789856 RepID=A0A7S9LT70_9RHOB|nr:LuxR family transcriptional regulator [Pontivivens ytuae]QPH54792.1 LuxR family transcriptional regulator [Pontivivens ytuae]